MNREPAPASTPPAASPATPLPTLTRAVTIGEGKSQVHVLTRFWANEDGRRCHACPRGQCNFAEGEGGTGSCVGVYPGEYDPSGPAVPARPPLRLRG